MKLKHRALALILSAIMVLAYMPGMAYASSDFNGEGFSDGSISIDDVRTVTITEEVDYYTYEFTPDHDGKYCFLSISDDDTYGRVLDSSNNLLEYNDDTGEDYDFAVIFEGKAGETYYLQATYLSNNTGEFFVKLEEIASPVSVSFSGDLSGDVGTDWIDFYKEGYKFTVTYSDGLQADYIMKADSDDVDYYKNGDTDSERLYFIEAPSINNDSGLLEEGNNEVSIIIEVEDTYLTTTVNVVGIPYDDDDDYDPDDDDDDYDPDEKRFTGDMVDEGIIKVGETQEVTISNNFDYASFEFTPEKTGFYIFHSNSEDMDIDTYGRVLEKSTNEVISYNDDNESGSLDNEFDFEVLFYAEKGKSYLLQAAFYSKGTGSFSVELADGPTWMVRDNDYAIGSGAVSIRADILGNEIPATLQYQWFTSGDDDWEEIPGATSSTYVTNSEGYFKCEVTDPDTGEVQNGYYYVYFDYRGVWINNFYYQLHTRNSADGAEVCYNEVEPTGSFAFPASVKLADGKTYPLTYIRAWMVYIDDGVYLGKNCKTVTVPASVKTIEKYALGYYMNEADDYNWAKIPGFTIIGTTGSAAQRYAAANGFAFRDPVVEKEAARQGTKVAGLPKVKISKPAAAKKSVTVKWKKLSKKELKKGVTNIEVWVCPNKAFGAGDTVIKFAGKKKASLKVKGLKKGTYYVKVRAIKKVGGVKYYTAWSKVKKVKVKK